MTRWSFLTSHARVLLAVASDPDLRLREIGDTVGISERRAYDIVADLTRSGYIAKTREGRRNRYEIQQDRPLRDELTGHRTIGDMLALLADTERAEGEHPEGSDGAPLVTRDR